MESTELKTLIGFIKENTVFNEIISKTIIVEYYTIEKGGSLDSILHLQNGDIITFRDFDTSFIWSIWSLINLYFNATSYSTNRWNKAEFTVYKDGRYDVKTWWDSEFQISLYGEDN